MGRPARVLPAAVDLVRDRIDTWRRTRARRTRMPEDLWRAAVDLAREHGVWAVARAVGVRCDTLGLRLKESRSPASARAETGFVELPPPAPAPCAVTVLELTRADGTRLTVRCGGAIEAPPLIEAFCRVR